MGKVKIATLVVVSILIIGIMPVQAQQQQEVEWDNFFRQIDALYDTGQYDAAMSQVKERLEIIKKQLESDNFDEAKTFRNLIVLNKKIELISKADLAAKEKSLGPDHPDVAKSSLDLAMFYMLHEQYEQAEQFFKKALAVQEKSLESNYPDVGETLLSLVVLHYMQDQYDEATPFVEKALTLEEKSSKPSSFSIIKELRSFANICRDKGYVRQAEKIEKHLEKIQNTRQ